MVVVDRLRGGQVMREEDILHPVLIRPVRKVRHLDHGLVWYIDMVEDIDRIFCIRNILYESLDEDTWHAGVEFQVLLKVVLSHRLLDVFCGAAIGACEGVYMTSWCGFWV